MIEEYPGLYALSVLYERSRACANCGLSKSRSQVVFGYGNSEQPDIAFVGAAPGGLDEMLGRPFAGPNDSLLWTAIGHLGYETGALYYVNAVACTTEKPADAEIEACRPLWQAQLIAVDPKTIVCLGAVAARAVIGTETEVPELRGKWYAWRGIPVRVTFPASYMQQGQSAKQSIWNDLCAVQAKLQEKR